MIKEVTHEHKGIYACLENGTIIIKTYNVTVYEAPYFVKKMHNLFVKPAGYMVRLNCKAGGYPPPNITWYRDGVTPPTRGFGEIKMNHWGLTLADSVPADKGNYTCVVCNEVDCNNFTYYLDIVGKEISLAMLVS